MFEKQIKDENNKIEEQDKKRAHASHVETEVKAESKQETEDDLYIPDTVDVNAAAPTDSKKFSSCC